jgi:thymidylate synthase (FAD)
VAETKRPTSPTAEEILGLYFPVLDHGFVALVDYLGTDECIERAARVSYGYGTRKQSVTRGPAALPAPPQAHHPERDGGAEVPLLHAHVHRAPVDPAPHGVVNEYSGRYSLMPMLFYTPEAEQLQTQSKRNNQGRSGQAVDAQLFAEAQRRWSAIRRESTDAYGW